LTVSNKRIRKSVASRATDDTSPPASDFVDAAATVVWLTCTEDHSTFGVRR
jgi:hypothetical protein